MPGDTNFTMRMDSTLKSQAEDVLNELGLTMSGAVTMFLKEVVRDQGLPLTLSLRPRNAVYAELLEAQRERLNGFQGRNGRDVLADMERVIGEAESVG